MHRIERHNINFPLLLRVAGWLLILETVFMMVPLGTCLYYGEADWLCFALTCGFTLLVGLCLTRLVRSSQNHMGKREGFLLTAMVWVVFSFFGMMPFLMSPVEISVGAAYFEAMSGFTTTGATVIDNIDRLSRSLHLWRALMQWIGGMGIILFTLAVIPMLNHSGGMQMFNAEVTGITHDKIRPRISQTAKSLWGIYILLTVACALLLWAGPMDWFDSICHAFGTVSTGGCSTVDDGVDAWASPYILGVVTLFMFLGGVNFTLLYRVASGHPGALAANTTLPVIGIPCAGANFDGMDALLSTVQMPSGIPVATVAVNGAKNAALLAIQIMAVTDMSLADKLSAAREKETAAVLKADKELREQYQ